MDELFDEFDELIREKTKYKKTNKRNRSNSPKYGDRDRTDRIPKVSLNLTSINPKTPNQKKAFDAYRKGYNLMLSGTAGTGKTFSSLFLALNTVLDDASGYKRVVIVRSMTPTKDTGFLPGTLAEKQKVYEGPYSSICAELFNRGDAYDLLKKSGKIEFHPTSYLRGLTLRDSIVILDEFQNCTLHEIDTIVTRIGENCKLIISGDTKQTDLNKKYEVSGGHEALRIIHRMQSFKSIEFGVDDICRSGVVRDWIVAREELDI